MHSDHSKPNVPDEESLPPSWLEALRALPSEQGEPTRETDTAVIANARETLAAIRRRRLHLRMWPALAAAACVIVSLTLLGRPRATPALQASALPEDKYALILREVSAVFPRQIESIVADGSDLQIALSDQPRPNSEPAVVIKVCEQGDCKTVITYIGQTVTIGNHRVTVRADEKGGILIDSPDFHGSGASPAQPVPGLHITTRRI